MPLSLTRLMDSFFSSLFQSVCRCLSCSVDLAPTPAWSECNSVSAQRPSDIG